MAQFELFDAPEPPEEDIYNTGLRLIDGQLKPAWGAYRLPLVVSRLGRGRVEVWGQVRPADGPVTPRVQARRRGVWATVASAADQLGGLLPVQAAQPRRPPAGGSSGTRRAAR